MHMEYVVYWNCTFKQFPNAAALIPGQVMSDLRTRDARKIENTMTLITIFPFNKLFNFTDREQIRLSNFIARNNFIMLL